MVVVRSEITPTLMSGGMAAVSLASCFLMLSTVVMTFAPGCLNTTRNTPRLPCAQPAWVRSAGPDTASPMSRTRTAAPLR